MADSEERILALKITQDPYTCGIGGICKDKVCLKKLCEMGIPRQEAIEKMAKGLHNYEWEYSRYPKWEELNEDTRQDYRKQAEAALNALLGEEK